MVHKELNKLISLKQIPLYFKGFEWRGKMSMYNCFNFLEKLNVSEVLSSTAQASVTQRQEM